MPSSTPNYGWTYPISSDDLNAGATSIGLLATGADTSLQAEAVARTNSDINLNSLISLRPTSNKSAINISYASVATSSLGAFTIATSNRIVILKAWRAGFGANVIVGATGEVNTFTAFTAALGGIDGTPSWILGLYYMEFPA